MCAAHDQLPKLRLLLNAKGDPNARAESGETPLSVAKMKGHEFTVYILQEAGATD